MSSSPARVAAKYKSKREVPRADGSGTTIVYEYSDRQVQNRNRAKAKRVEALRKKIDKVRADVKKGLKSETPRERLTALAVAIIDETYSRVGNAGSAKNGHFGITTLQKEHVKFNSGGVTLKYVGKSGVEQEKRVTKKPLVDALKASLKGKKKGDRVFCDGSSCVVTAKDVNRFLKTHEITAKDLRGLHANEEAKKALAEIRKSGPKLPSDSKEREKLLKAEFKQALEAAAAKMGNEPSTLRNQYLVQGLEAEYLENGKVLVKLSNLRVATLSDTEKEERENRRLIPKSPKKKPPRQDLRRRRVQDSESSDDPDAKQDKKDKSQNYKDASSRVAGRFVVAARRRMASRVVIRWVFAKKGPTDNRVKVRNKETGKVVYVNKKTLRGPDSANFEPYKEEGEEKGGEKGGEKGEIEVAVELEKALSEDTSNTELASLLAENLEAVGVFSSGEVSDELYSDLEKALDKINRDSLVEEAQKAVLGEDKWTDSEYQITEKDGEEISEKVRELLLKKLAPDLQTISSKEKKRKAESDEAEARERAEQAQREKEEAAKAEAEAEESARKELQSKLVETLSSIDRSAARDVKGLRSENLENFAEAYSSAADSAKGSVAGKRLEEEAGKAKQTISSFSSYSIPDDPVKAKKYIQEYAAAVALYEHYDTEIDNPFDVFPTPTGDSKEAQKAAEIVGVQAALDRYADMSEEGVERHNQKVDAKIQELSEPVDNETSEQKAKREAGLKAAQNVQRVLAAKKILNEGMDSRGVPGAVVRLYKAAEKSGKLAELLSMENESAEDSQKFLRSTMRSMSPAELGELLTDDHPAKKWVEILGDANNALTTSDMDRVRDRISDIVISEIQILAKSVAPETPASEAEVDIPETSDSLGRQSSAFSKARRFVSDLFKPLQSLFSGSSKITESSAAKAAEAASSINAGVDEFATAARKAVSEAPEKVQKSVYPKLESLSSSAAEISEEVSNTAEGVGERLEAIAKARQQKAKDEELRALEKQAEELKAQLQKALERADGLRREIAEVDEEISRAPTPTNPSEVSQFLEQVESESSEVIDSISKTACSMRKARLEKLWTNYIYR